jgi:SOS response regulatory protein OraA/RecX
MAENSQKELLNEAGTLLARRSFSRGEMRVKLSKLAQSDEVELALDRLEHLNLLNDADYSYNFAFYHIRQRGWSPAKVRNSLERRHVSQANIDAAIMRVLDEFDGTSTTLGEYLKRYCAKKGTPSDLNGYRRLLSHLRLRGFDEDSIISELKQIVPAEILQRMGTGD